jgi:hypothetical protein
MSTQPESKLIAHFNATDWKSAIAWGIREGLIRFPMSTVLEPDLSPELKEAMKLKSKAQRTEVGS